VRRPAWAGDGFTIAVNGETVAQPPLASLRAGSAGGRVMGNEDAIPQPSSYVELKRTWKSGDTIKLTLPKTVRLEPTPDNKQVAAIMWGPLVLAGDLGPRREGRGSAESPIPVLVAGTRPVGEWVVPAGTRAGDFRAQQVGRLPASPSAAPMDVSLTPFHRTHRRTYSVYFDVVSPAEFDVRAAAVVAERERVKRLEAATVAFVQPGDAQQEKDFNYQSDPADRPVGRNNGRSQRSGTGWFSYDLAVDANTDMALVVTYYNELGIPPAPANFEFLADGKAVARYSPNANATGFYDAQYTVPADLTRGKSKVTVRVQSAEKGRIVPIFGLRMVRTSSV